jgi:hypothetical protein
MELLDKIHGAWYGKCLGGAAGAPVEGVKDVIDVADFTEIMNPDLPNDDLDIQLLWLNTLKTYGNRVTSEVLAKEFHEKCWYPFMEYGLFHKNYERGILPPLSGSFNNPVFRNGMGCPIRSEIWGLICPNQPEKAVLLAEMDGIIDHTGESVYAEQFLAAMESLLFSETDILRLIELGLGYIPGDCKVRLCVETVLAEWEKLDLMQTRELILKNFGNPDFTNVTQNMGFIVAALLYGGGDLRKTVNAALKCGYDTDCTCASAAAVLGGILGFEKIPEDLKLINDYFVIGIDIERDNNSILSLARETAEVARTLGEISPGITGVEYLTQPALGVGDYCDARFKSEAAGEFILPKDWTVRKMDGFYRFENKGNSVANINIIRAGDKAFGIAGASLWKIYGPYFEPLRKSGPADWPPPHGEGCVLPGLEAMVNNSADFNSEYACGDPIIINAYEDLLPIDENIGYSGQAVFYAEQKVNSPDGRDAWAVIGNNDGFVLRINGEEILSKDEMRRWTPYNNAAPVRLQKGENIIRLKLLRRGDELRFSFALRGGDARNHWHKQRWITDLTSVL